MSSCRFRWMFLYWIQFACHILPLLIPTIVPMSMLAINIENAWLFFPATNRWIFDRRILWKICTLHASRLIYYLCRKIFPFKAKLPATPRVARLICHKKMTTSPAIQSEISFIIRRRRWMRSAAHDDGLNQLITSAIINRNPPHTDEKAQTANA